MSSTAAFCMEFIGTIHRVTRRIMKERKKRVQHFASLCDFHYNTVERRPGIAWDNCFDTALWFFTFSFHFHSLTFFISFATTNQPLSRARYDSLQVKEWINSPRVVASLLESQQKRQKCGTFRSKSWIKELLIFFSVASSDEARRARSQLFANRLTVKKIMFVGRESKLDIVGTMM